MNNYIYNKRSHADISDTLNRDEAVKLFKEVISACRLNIASVSLTLPLKDNGVDGYQLHIKSYLSSVDKLELQAIATRHGLVWKEENGTIMIYKPDRIGPFNG